MRAPASPPPTPLLAVDGISVRFGAVQALERVSLEIRRGEVVAIIGPNGAGKTTLVNQLSGLMKPDGGVIRFEGRDINAHGTSVLLVEQNATMALAIADEGYVMEHGKVVKDGPAAELLADKLADLTEYWQIIFGPMLILIVLFAKGGIEGALGQIGRRDG